MPSNVARSISGAANPGCSRLSSRLLLYFGVTELLSLVADFETTLPCFFFVFVAVLEVLVVEPAGSELVVVVADSVARFLPLSLVTVVLLESVELDT